jgi:predicted SAM-dependent methyltransferase
MRLILGANERQVPGYKHHDVKPYPGIDYVCDIWDIGKHVESGECEEVQLTHVLEHFSKAEVPKLLAIIKSLLAPGGTFYVEVPNFAWHAELVSQGKAEEAVYYAFGGQLDEWDFHKTGFTPTILGRTLTEAGFVDIDIDGWTSLCCTCHKSR